MDARRVCEECTQNCVLVHGQKLDPSSVDNSFIKLLYANYDFSKFLYLPPKVPELTIPVLEDGQHHLLEDFTGKRWLVTLGTSYGALAFEKGWDQFYADHELKEGYILQFNYRGSHFVVKIYDTTGTPKVLFRETGNNRNRSATNRSAGVEGKILLYASTRTPASSSLAAECGDNRMQSQSTTVNEPPRSENREGRSQLLSNTFLKSRAERIRENHVTVKDKGSDSQSENGGFKVPSTSTVKVTNTRDSQCMTNDKPIGDSAVSVPMSTDGSWGSEKRQCGLKFSSSTSPITSTENRTDNQVTTKDNPVSENTLSGKPPVEVAGDTISRKEISKVDNDCKDNLSDIPFKKRLIMHRGNTTEFSIKSKIVGSQEAGGSKRSSGLNVPEKEPTELRKKRQVSSSEQSNSGKHPKSNKLDQKSSWGIEDEEVPSAVNTASVESHDQESLDEFRELCKAVVERKENLELQECLPSISLCKGMDKKVVCLRGPNELRCPVLYVETRGLKALISGWEIFYCSNGLQKGDECTFVLETNEGDPIYTVNIFRKLR